MVYFTRVENHTKWQDTMIQIMPVITIHGGQRFTGYVFNLGLIAISWCSKKQLIVSLSSTEVEYRAVALATQESTWLLQLMKSLCQLIDYSVHLYCDNQSAICMAENPFFYVRTKHVEVHYHFIRKKVLQGEVHLKYVNTDDQVADIFIKSLKPSKFTKFCELLNMSMRKVSAKGKY